MNGQFIRFSISSETESEFLSAAAALQKQRGERAAAEERCHCCAALKSRMSRAMLRYPSGAKITLVFSLSQIQRVFVHLRPLIYPSALFTASPATMRLLTIFLGVLLSIL
jgi:hypothetical protein